MDHFDEYLERIISYSHEFEPDKATLSNNTLIFYGPDGKPSGIVWNKI